MWQDYRFVATLDPYEPRCGCCPLLRTRETDLMEGRDPLPAHADTHRVRLDVGTGVCVRAREVGGPGDGQGHEWLVADAAGPEQQPR